MFEKHIIMKHCNCNLGRNFVEMQFCGQLVVYPWRKIYSDLVKILMLPAHTRILHFTTTDMKYEIKRIMQITLCRLGKTSLLAIS